MGSFADGMKMGQGAYQMAINNKRQAEKDEREKVMQGREDTAYAREQAKLKNIDDATAEYGLMQKTGVRNQANIQANDVDFDMAVEATGRGLPMPAAQPQMQEWTRPTALQDNQGLQRLSMAREDFNGLRALKTEERGLHLDEGRKAEFARLGKLKPEELADVLGSEFSKDGSGIDAMLTYDPKANKYLFASKIPGFPSQSLSRTELMNHAMGLWESGNGDLKAGLATMMDTLKTKRQLDDSNFNRSAKIAEGNSGLHFKGLQAGEDAKRTGIAASGLALRRQEGNRTSPQNLREYIDPKGNTVLLDVTGLPKDREGRLSIPAGLRPKTARPEFTMKDVTDLATMYTGQPDPDAPKVSMSATRAMQVARQELGAGGSTKSASDLLLEGLPMEDPRKVPVAASAPKGGMTPPRQITTLVPPRSGAEMRPRPVESDQEVFIRSMGY